MEITSKEDKDDKIKSNIICPKCDTSADFIFSKSIIDSEDFITTAFFQKGRICTHQFNAYIDIHGDVRGYQLIDFVVPSFDSEESHLRSTSEKIIKSKNINLDMIEMSYSRDFFIYIIRIIFFRKKAIILENDNDLITNLTNLLNYLTEDSFNYDIFFYSKEKYNHVRKSYWDHIVIDKDKIINSPSKFLSKRKKKMKKQSRIENYLLDKFLALRTYEFALHVLKSEIKTIYSLANTIAHYTIELKSKEKINISRIKILLKAKNKNNEYNPYIDYLIEIARNYFGANLPYIYSTSFNSL